MIRFRWGITGLTIIRDAVDGRRDLVVDVTWELVGEDETTGVMAMRYGTQLLGDHCLHAVVEGMTPGLVTDWLQAALPPGTVQMLEDDITARIAKQVDDTRYQVTAPWRVRAEPEAGAPDVVSEQPLRPDVL